MTLAINAAVDTVDAAAIVVIAADICNIPALAANKPVPIANTPILNIANAAANANITGVIGANAIPANPNITNVPASAPNATAIPFTGILLSTYNAGVSKPIATAAPIIAATPGSAPFIALTPIATIANAPPIAASPLLICSHDNAAFFSNASAIILRACDTAIIPKPIIGIFFGIMFMAIATDANEPARATSPCPICSKLIEPKSLTTCESVFNDCDNITIPAPTVIIFLLPLDSLVNIASSAKSTPIADTPLTSSSTLNSPNVLAALASSFIACDNIKIPAALAMVFAPVFPKLRNNAISPIRTVTPASPLARPSQLN